MANSIFSTYSGKENRVTSTILAVFEKLSTTTVTRILQVLIEDSTVELIEYVNQVKGSESVPDGRIKGLSDYLIETKVVKNAVEKKQIINHCRMLEYDFSKLIVLTPDDECPVVLKDIEDKYQDRIIWGNFDMIINGIDAVLEDSTLLLDREKFLLTELKDFIYNERLISEDYSQKVVVVPASKAWEFYNKYNIYRCQPNRTFKPTKYIGFYADQEIKSIFPEILAYIDKIDIKNDELSSHDLHIVGDVDEKLILDRFKEFKKQIRANYADSNNETKTQKETETEFNKYMLLTESNDKRTFRIEHAIQNDKLSYSQKSTAFVQKQTYLNINDLKGKYYTSEL